MVVPFQPRSCPTPAGMFVRGKGDVKGPIASARGIVPPPLAGGDDNAPAMPRRR
jgi:hypothetical protein